MTALLRVSAFCTATSVQVGFLDDWKRVNEALSRARTALVAVGHMSTLLSGKTWSALLDHVMERGCLVQQHEIMC